MTFIPLWLVIIFKCLHSLQTCWIFFICGNLDFTPGVKYKTTAQNFPSLGRKSTVCRIEAPPPMLIPKVAMHKVTLSENSIFQKIASGSYLIWRKRITSLSAIALWCKKETPAKIAVHLWEAGFPFQHLKIKLCVMLKLYIYQLLH